MEFAPQMPETSEPDFWEDCVGVRTREEYVCGCTIVAELRVGSKANYLTLVLF